MPNPYQVTDGVNTSWDDIFGSEMSKGDIAQGERNFAPGQFGRQIMHGFNSQLIGEYLDPQNKSGHIWHQEKPGFPNSGWMGGKGFNDYLDFSLGREKAQYIRDNWKDLDPARREALFKMLSKYEQLYSSIHSPKPPRYPE